MVRITIVVTPSCAEWYASQWYYTKLRRVVRITDVVNTELRRVVRIKIGSYAELRRVVRIKIVVTPSCAEWTHQNGSYTELRRVVRITIVLHRVAPSGTHKIVVTPSYAEWYASQIVVTTELRRVELKW